MVGSGHTDAQVLLGTSPTCVTEWEREWEYLLPAPSFFYHIPFLYFLFLFCFTPCCSSHSKNPSSALESELLPGPSGFLLWISVSLSPLFLFPPELSFEILSFSFLTQTGSQAVNWICFD